MRDAAERGEYAAERGSGVPRSAFTRISTNWALLSLLDVFWLAVSRATERSSVVDPPDPRETVESHKRILDALRERSTEQMHTAFDYHYSRWEFRLAKSFESTDQR